MFKKIRSAIIAQYNEYTTKTISRIKTNENALKNALTATRYAQYESGKIDREKAVCYAIDRITRSNNKTCGKRIERLEKIANAPDVKSIQISIEWKKSRVWGYNPTATVTIYTDKNVYSAIGKASGCGYDKRSAAVAKALNQIDPALKLIYILRENGNLPYGAGYEHIAEPYFEGGVGISCYHTIFAECGLEKVTENGTKLTDYYYYEKR